MKAYLVRWAYDPFYWEEHPQGGLPVTPTTHRLVRLFSSPTEAEAYRQRLERGRLPPPPKANPFQPLRAEHPRGPVMVCRLEDLTSMPVEVLTDWLKEAGLGPPAPSAEPRAWADWYDTEAPRMTDMQRCRVWQALDRLSFYETIEVDLET
jgi:hypothetical protein